MNSSLSMHGVVLDLLTGASLPLANTRDRFSEIQFPWSEVAILSLTSQEYDCEHVSLRTGPTRRRRGST
jgi:hypothetical protein